MLDLLPLRQCFMARENKPPAWLTETIQRVVPMLRYMQLGDRGLGRFNGMAVSEIDRLAAVLSYSSGAPASQETAAASGYVRLARRGTCLLMDSGQVPPLAYSSEAHAGALSFEMTSGAWPVIVNAGAPGPASQAWRRQSRGTPAHSTVLLNDVSSAKLIKNGDERRPLRDLLTGPDSAEAKYTEPGDGAAEVQGYHNGYQQRFGLIHARVLRLSAQGDKLIGADRIFHQRGGSAAKPPRDMTYSIHFHLHPQARVHYGDEPATAVIELRSGETWTFSAFGSKLSLEDSLFFASVTGPTRSVQIVLRGHVFADTQVRWLLERGDNPPEPLPQPFLR